jgi:predicted GNAT family acetyltransferase
MNPTILHDAAASRFSAVVEGQPCRLDYRLHGNVMTIVHAEVPATVGGRGIAAALVQASFDHARSAGWRVVPACSYAAAYAERHPEYADLVLPSGDWIGGADGDLALWERG